MDNSQDYICVVVGGLPNSSGRTVHRVFYSTDSGDTFIEGPIMYNLDLSGDNVTYFLDIATPIIA